MTSDAQAVISIYRSLRRQVRLLPTEYLRQFFRIKLGDNVRSIWKQKHGEPRRALKINGLRSELRKLQKANTGNHKSFESILGLAYGRKGKLKWELLEPLLSDPNAPPPDRIISEVESSRPPVYSTELHALLTSAESRTTKALRPAALESPPTLPPRADPTSSEAHLLGPFSKRREVNIRWRYFRREAKKVLPPLQILLEEKTSSGLRRTSDPEALKRCNVRSIGLQGTGVMDELQAIVKSSRPRSETATNSEDLSDHQPPLQSHLRTRFLRRRYQRLLGQLPVLTCAKPNPAKPATYKVSLLPEALKNSLRGASGKMPDASTADVAWFAEHRTDRKKTG